jgi:hypothetical protein
MVSGLEQKVVPSSDLGRNASTLDGTAFKAYTQFYSD